MSSSTLPSPVRGLPVQVSDFRIPCKKWKILACRKTTWSRFSKLHTRVPYKVPDNYSPFLESNDFILTKYQAYLMFDRHRALGLLQAGLPISEVSLRMNVNRTTIFRLKQRLHETNTVSDRPRSGRPRCTTQRQDRNLVRNHMNNRFLSASPRHTKERNNQRISANTVRRRLSCSGIRARRPYIGPILAQRHRHQRTLWAQEHAA
ncbi:transposable element Tc1 transposase [Elysia marginata]|uniref:Transposable element Tc1 transposase n=1 Tax=Elysia marginata TaxID=1093978 RepID=A0AAV4IZ00_9GAST|nr:transposable element Tc1 transposase [Elysia marginata]